MRGKMFLVMLTGLVMSAGVSTRSAMGALFSYTSQTRSVTATTHGPAGDLIQTLTSPDFSVFDALATVTDAPGFAKQHQASTLGADTIEILGDFTGLQPTLVGTGSAKGSSVTDILFTVLDPTPVKFTMALSGTDSLAASVTRTVQLTGPGMSVTWHPLATSGPVSLSQSGVLTPGTYHLVANIGSQKALLPSDTSVATSWSVHLVPEPGCVGALGIGAAGFGSRRRRLGRCGRRDST
jgi:hypothetical protein